ncbi:hypothetical protein C8Q76DRAFT_618918 [Earliella scabrosa]|nr:hypothetical protein C8Q76DRAFT_618918 [Earliella scabrosa]
MRHHASLTANLPSLSLASVFQAAAGRAWVRTCPTRAYHRTHPRAEGVVNTDRAARGGHDTRGETGGPSSARIPPSSVVFTSLCDVRGHYASSPSPSTAASAAGRPFQTALPDADNHAPRPTPSRAPTRRGVTHVDVESLSPRDYEHSHCDSDGYPAYESEPPWEDIQASVPKSLLPRVTVFQPKESPQLPHPATGADLLENLVLAITDSPPASLAQVLSYHAAHPSLQSTSSFNLVIRYAIKCASFGTVTRLLARMVRDGISGDLETRALRVRSMVRSGLWNMAWQEEMAQMKADGLAMPLPVWLEFLGSVKMGAIMGSTSSYGRADGGRPKPLRTPDPTVTAARFHALMQHAPLVTPDEWQRVPPRVTYAVVRSLVQLDRRSAAVELTRSYFQSLPREIDGEWRRECLAIIHLHMTPGRVCNLSAHFAARKTLFAFLDMHPNFRPTATTLFYLLRTLKSTKRCGERADKLVLSFERRWGGDILDDRVRRRWASLWLKQARPDRAERILEGQHALDVLRAEWRAEKDVMGGESDKGRARRLRWLDLNRVPRRAKERWRWRRLRRRFWRIQVRRRG